MANGDGIELVEDGENPTSNTEGSASQDTTESSGGTGGGKFDGSNEGDNSEGAGDSGADSGQGQPTTDSGAAGTTGVTQLVLLDADGNQIGAVPLQVDNGTVSMEVGTVETVPEGFYVQTGEQLGVITAGTVLALVLIFAVFGAVCVGTLIRSFEWKR